MSGNPFAGQGLDTQVQGAYTGALGNTANFATGQTSLANTDLTPYNNQYTQGVVNTTMSELDRQRAQQGQQLASEAQSQNAFGGDRFAIQQAENDRNWNAQKANTASNLYNTGFNTSVDNAKYDLSNQAAATGQLGGLANQGFQWGNDLAAQNAASAASQQGSQQSLLDAIKAQYAGFTGQGTDPGLKALLGTFGALGGNMSSSHSSGDTSGSSVSLTGK